VKKQIRVKTTGTAQGRSFHCWEFFRCDPERQKDCLMRDLGTTPCWLVDVACCRMTPDAVRPISIKKVICKNCAFYKFVHKKTR
jgi:hypothetical protein